MIGNRPRATQAALLGLHGATLGQPARQGVAPREPERKTRRANPARFSVLVRFRSGERERQRDPARVAVGVIAEASTVPDLQIERSHLARDAGRCEE